MLLALAAALAVTAQDGSPPPVPLPEVEFVKCVPFTMADGISSGRHEFLVRNTNPTSRLVAAEFTWTRPGSGSGFDGALGGDDGGVAIGGSELMRFSKPCEFDPVVAAAIYADGTAVGDPKIVEKMVERRKETLHSVQMVLSVLRTTKAGADGVDSVEGLDALLKQVAGSDTRQYGASRSVLAAFGNQAATNQILNRLGPRRVVPKATIIEVMEAAVRKLERSIRVSRHDRAEEGTRIQG